jgi:required for proper spore cortex formation and coat assembly (stage IV sporulation)
MEEEYNVPIICSSVDTVSKDELNNMLRTALYEFPVVDINVNIPKWIDILPMENEIKMHYLEKIKEAIYKVNKLKDVDTINNVFLESEYISKSYISNFDTSTGNVTITLESSDELYEKVLKESIGNKEITKSSLLNMFISYNENESELKNIKSAIKMAKNTGYGIMHPTIKDMKLSTPEIIKQGSRFGVKLKAQASSVHLIRVDVESTFEPIIGSEMQSKELIDYIMKDYETDKNSIWKSEIFGRSLEQIVKEGIEAKLAMMPETARFKLANTVTKIVNKGANNLIAIVI